jgi:hypothetical protein
MIAIVRAERTCYACPSQWDAWDSLGRYWYFRYRHGHGEARQYTEGPGWYEAAWSPEAVATLGEHWGHPLDGITSLEEFCQKLGFELAVELKTADELYQARMEQAIGEADWSWL